jgi:hypothetical protein
MKNTEIILLGTNCKIVFAMENLRMKFKSGLFDWFDSSNFDDILYCIKKLSKGQELDIIYDKPGFPGNVFIDITDIRSSHYKYEEYKNILKRRSNRFLESIRSSNPILFIREDLFNFTTEEQLIIFKELIYKINPDCNYKFLLLSLSEKYVKIDEDKVFCYINEEYKYENYINEICKENIPLKNNNIERLEKD